MTLEELADRDPVIHEYLIDKRRVANYREMAAIGLRNYRDYSRLANRAQDRVNAIDAKYMPTLGIESNEQCWTVQNT